MDQGTFRWKIEGRRKNEEDGRKLNVRALDDPTTRWLHGKRLDIVSEEKPTSSNIETEWENTKNIVKKAAFESLGTVRSKIPPKK